MKKEMMKKLEQIEYLAVTNKAMLLLNMLCMENLLRDSEEDAWAKKAFVFVGIGYIVLAIVHNLKSLRSVFETK